ncbi:phosphatidylglycerophosphatase A [Cribrihabitans marinus]|uniref:Phosphatidylglycerophosphatase A n=1 Tax=Cribrihabitans marinus TaxID=1227549 RepID=A0A1H6VPG8_9RHOB|nr:phosphatidylglycerophosphatase A [Cribrihabitans marinus]GGH25394.1 phosphatidylglycerophosphatase A [Cribrihabitans marinus]SEJ06533.1 phosphatidylglycerophosphatase A [Cribrihabitans marinus]
MRLAQFIGTLGGIGYLRPAPGTWGSLAALPMAWALHELGGFLLLALATVLALVIGTWAAEAMTRDREDMDPREFVMDEVAGQFTALWAVSYPAWANDIDILALWPGWIVAFVLFRIFDMWKVGPVGWADRQKGATGVMMDDVIAGIMAAVGVVVLAGVSHGLLGW